DSETAYLNLSDGFLFDASSILVDDQNVHYQTIRNSLRLAYKVIIAERITFQGSNFYQPSMRDGSDYNLRLNNDLSFLLFRGLSLKAILTYNRINRTAS